MVTMLIALHVLICVLLVVTVLLQFGKGAETGAIMGGGASQAVFSSSAKGNFLTKTTTILAIGFMVNSIALTTIKSREAKRSLFDNEAPVAAPLNSDVQALENKGAEAAPANGAATAPATSTETLNAAPATNDPVKAATPDQTPDTTTAEPTAPVPATKTPSTKR